MQQNARTCSAARAARRCAEVAAEFGEDFLPAKPPLGLAGSALAHQRSGGTIAAAGKRQALESPATAQAAGGKPVAAQAIPADRTKRRRRDRRNEPPSTTDMAYRPASRAARSPSA